MRPRTPPPVVRSPLTAQRESSMLASPARQATAFDISRRIPHGGLDGCQCFGIELAAGAVAAAGLGLHAGLWPGVNRQQPDRRRRARGLRATSWTALRQPKASGRWPREAALHQTHYNTAEPQMAGPPCLHPASLPRCGGVHRHADAAQGSAAGPATPPFSAGVQRAFRSRRRPSAPTPDSNSNADAGSGTAGTSISDITKEALSI